MEAHAICTTNAHAARGTFVARGRLSTELGNGQEHKSRLQGRIALVLSRIDIRRSIRRRHHISRRDFPGRGPWHGIGGDRHLLLCHARFHHPWYSARRIRDKQNQSKHILADVHDVTPCGPCGRGADAGERGSNLFQLRLGHLRGLVAWLVLPNGKSVLQLHSPQRARYRIERLLRVLHTDPWLAPASVFQHHRRGRIRTEMGRHHC
mmetsp:Transcript_7756/g.22487  ORF Transcript_7756/g.22487 Transcript_7756/m.22487 type:complete len:207 (-) Transcript_7756:239-859(-)